MIVIRLLKVLAILVAAAVLAAAVWLLRAEETGLAPLVLVVGSWEEDGVAPVLGTGRGPDGQMQGPASFAVDAGGRLYVADTYRSRVLVFDAGGKPQGELLLPEGFRCSDLGIDGRGVLHLVEGHTGRILQLDPKQAVAVRPTVPEGPGLSAIEAVAGGPGRELYLLGSVLDDQRYQRRVSRLEGPGEEVLLAARELTAAGPAVPPEGVLDLFVRGLAVDPRGSLYLHVQEPGRDGGTLQVLPGGRGPGRSIPLDAQGLPSPLRLAGVDRRGRIYLTTVDPADPARLWVLDGRGKLLAVRELHAPGPVRLRVTVRVGARGEVYTARSTRLGMEYAVWRPVLRPRLFRVWRQP